MRRIVILAGILLALALLLFTCVGSSDLAVRETLGGEAIILTPGLHARVPLYHRVYRYDTDGVKIDEPIAIVTRDNATFKLPCTIAARVSPGDLLTFHRGRSGRDTETYLSETVRNSITDAAKTMNSDQILAAGAGPRLAQQVSADLIAHGISDDGLQVGSPGPRVIFTAVVDHLNRKFPASARRLAETSLQADPNQALYHAAMGMVLEAEGKPLEAEQRYLEALYLDPTAVEPMSRLFVLTQTSKDPEAPARLQRLLIASLQKKQDSAVHHDWLGQIYMRTGQPDKAEQAFQTAIGLAPKVPEFRISLGSLRAQQNRLPDAKTEYEEALKLRPDHPLALYNLGVTYALQGDLDHAIENFEKAEKAGPPTVGLLNSLAQAYEQKGETAKAVAALRRSLQQRPQQPERAAALKRLEAQLRSKG